jgi:hypothetical protein
MSGNQNIPANVVIDSELRAKYPDYTISSSPREFFSFMVEVARANPLWSLHTDTRLTFDEIRVTRFRVKQDGIELGVVASDNMRNGTAGFRISNERIRSTLSRTSAKFTSDPKKAMLLVKKMFYKPDTGEKLEKANAEAQTILNRALRAKSRAWEQGEHTLNQNIIALVRSFGIETFLQKLGHVDNTAMSTLLREITHNHAELRTVEEVNKAFSDGKTSMVVVVDKNYIVKTGDNVQLYDDNTLPEQLRGGLGMLKLVEPEQVVTGIGCRISVDAFVVVLPTQES